MKKPNKFQDSVITKNFDFAIVVAAHKNVSLIPPLVDSMLKQHHKYFHVYVVADDSNTDNLIFESSQITILKPQTALHSKTKSINFAISNFNREHDVLVIFDSDNLVHPDFLKIMNIYFNLGFKAVQAHMLSKNFKNKYSKLDSIGHVYYTFLDRKMRMLMGLSSHILGLGFAIDFKIYQKISYSTGLGGFDKLLQAELVKRIPQIGFAEDAIVYDEKVESGVALENQRKRWLFTYFQYFKTNFNLFKYGIFHANFKIISFSLSLLRPPLVILLVSGIMITFINYFVRFDLFVFWILIIILFIVSFIRIILTESKQKNIVQGLIYIPLFAISQFKAFFGMHHAKRKYIQTETSKLIFIDDIIANENN